MEFLEKLVCQPESTDENLDLPFTSGAIGYAGFDTYGIFEGIQPELKDSIGTPDMYFMLYESALIFDHKRSVNLMCFTGFNAIIEKRDWSFSLGMDSKITLFFPFRRR